MLEIVGISSVPIGLKATAAKYLMPHLYTLKVKNHEEQTKMKNYP